MTSLWTRIGRAANTHLGDYAFPFTCPLQSGAFASETLGYMKRSGSTHGQAVFSLIVISGYFFDIRGSGVHCYFHVGKGLGYMDTRDVRRSFNIGVYLFL